MSISQEYVEQLLAATVHGNESEIRSATAALEAADSVAAFPFMLVALASGSPDEGRRVAAGAYLKNLLKKHWHLSDYLSTNEKLALRNQIVQALLQADPAAMKVLGEAFRIIIDNDFVRVNSWPELIPAIRAALQTSSIMNYQGDRTLNTMNVLVAIHAMTKPFRYFMTPSVAREPVPEQLELISQELLLPLHQMFYSVVQEMKSTKEQGALKGDNILLVACKCFHLAVWSHMPSALQAELSKWCDGFFIILETVQVQFKLDAAEHLLRMKTWKRVLQIFCTLVTRHRKHIDKILPKLTTVLLDLVGRGAVAKDIHPMQEHVISSALDAISNILETGPGWRLISCHFSSLLERAIFPALKLKEKDICDWKEDQEEYLRKNLPSDLDNTTGWRDDLYTPRRSALNLLGVISTSKGPPSSAPTKNTSAVKRKKGGKHGSAKDIHRTAGELLVVPFLTRFPLPPDGCALTSELAIDYYGALLAYGGLQEFLKAQKPEHLCMLLRNRVLPLYTMASPSPFLLANANWLLGELASCLPEELNKEIYHSLLKAFLAPNVGDLTWRPVRTSAAAAISALLEEEYKPKDWLPLLQAAVTGSRAPETDEGSVALQVLATIAQAGEDDIVPHVPAIMTNLQIELHKRIPCIPEPWPQIVESGFSALAALARSWDNAECEEGEEEGKQMQGWKDSCVAIGTIIAELLQQAWLVYPQGASDEELSPPSSCLDDASFLLGLLLKYTTDVHLVAKWKVEELVQAWSNLIADWSAWEEEEDLSVFEAIQETVCLQGRLPLQHFSAAATPAPPALPVRPRSILEGIATFISSAIETAYSSATWRACRLSHNLLHMSAASFENEEIGPGLVIRITQAAIQRFWQLSSSKVPLAKPLVLLIASCYLYSSDLVVRVVSHSKEKGTLLAWEEALADLALSTEELGLTMETELKLCVAALLKMVNEGCPSNVFQVGQVFDLQHKLLQSLLTCWIKLKELQDVEEESKCDGDGDDEDETESDEDDEDDDSEDDEELEETEEQFLQRYAQKAQELERDALDEAEGGEEEDGQELDLGVLELTDYKVTLYSFLEAHGRGLACLPPELLNRFVENFPEARQFFQ